MRALGFALVCLGACAVARADLVPRHVVDVKATAAQREAARLASDAAQALGQGDFAGAVALTDRALASSGNDFFAHYVRAEALSRLGRLDDALAAFKLAERDVPRDDRWSHAIVLWGRANAFHQRGRCDEAKAAFGDYVAFTKSDDEAGAQLAKARIEGCRPPWVAPVVPTAKPATAAPPPATPPTTKP
jgi:tetratricopeptide (TPR) repeat protein